MKNYLSVFVFVILIACSKGEGQPRQDVEIKTETAAAIQNTGLTIIDRFIPPNGYKRVASSAGTFGHFLQQLPLKPQGAQVTYFNGAKKPNRGIYAAVVDLPIGTKDLHQCADAIIRLRADYLHQQGRTDEIGFHYTNGFWADYKHWQKGYYPKVSGNTVQWVKGNKNADNYWKYLENIFSYAGTLSLQKELNQKEVKKLNIGDVFIQGGSPGHAVIVVDKAVQQNSGKIAYLLAQSYMPAQELHILNNPNSKSAWYFVTDETVINTPEWTFSTDDLHGFE